MLKFILEILVLQDNEVQNEIARKSLDYQSQNEVMEKVTGFKSLLPATQLNISDLSDFN